MGLERARLEQANSVGLLVPRRESGAKIVSRNGASPASSSILYILDRYVHYITQRVLKDVCALTL